MLMWWGGRHGVVVQLLKHPHVPWQWLTLSFRSVCATHSHELNVRKTRQPWPLPGNSSSPVHSPAGKVCPIENSTDTLNSSKGQLTAIPCHLARLPLPDSISVGGINVSQAIKLKGLRILILASPLLAQTQAFLYTSHHAARTQQTACVEVPHACLLAWCHHLEIVIFLTQSPAFSCTGTCKLCSQFCLSCSLSSVKSVW